MTEAKEEDIERIKLRLRVYKVDQLQFNEPHFTNQLQLREGSREEVVQHLLCPDALVYAYEEKGKQGDMVHCLYFAVSRSRTMKVPVIFDRNNKKGLYILTYILRYRNWEHMVRR